MKKLLAIICICLFALSCSKDDDDKMFFAASNGRYLAYKFTYDNNKRVIYLGEKSPNDSSDFESYCLDAKCPNDGTGHALKDIDTVYEYEPSTRSYYECKVCTAQFNKKGEAINEAAQGLKMQSYSFSWDENKKGYCVW